MLTAGQNMSIYVKHSIAGRFIFICLLVLSCGVFAENADSVLKAVEKSWQELNELGVQAYKAKEYESAVGLNKQALIQNQDDVPILTNLALALFKLDQLRESVEVSNKVIGLAKTKKQRANAYFNKGRASVWL